MTLVDAVKIPASRSHYLPDVGGEQMIDRLDIERVYRDHGDRLWWSLLGYTGDRDVASDAAAEAFAQALGTQTRIFDPASWVWRVAFRIATAELRNGHRRSSASPDGSYEIDDRPLQVMLALQELSAHQRAAFVLFYLDDRTTAQVADVLGIAPATVSVHLHRARRRLRTILGADDG